MPRQALQAYALPPEAELTHWWLGCNHCHALHDGTTNLHLISEVIDTDDLPPAYAPKTGPRDVVFLSLQGPNSYADGDGVYDGVCEVCHTETKYHRGDASGDHTHFPGANCSTCHDHANYFQPTGITDHPQAVTDCSNCHLGATGEPDLLGVHDYACQTCHPGGFDRTILGLIGVWQGDCTECHNPSVPETGNLETPTKGHHCVVCHGSQLPTSNPRQMHKDHVDDANCVVCHGFIPDTGTEVGSGNRAICLVCHSPGKHDSARHPVFHKKHAPKGVSCLECHGGERPPVDVVEGPPWVAPPTSVRSATRAGRRPTLGGGWTDSTRSTSASPWTAASVTGRRTSRTTGTRCRGTTTPSGSSSIGRGTTNAGSVMAPTSSTPRKRSTRSTSPANGSGATTATTRPTAGPGDWSLR